jgi:hypothetical protein
LQEVVELEEVFGWIERLFSFFVSLKAAKLLKNLRGRATAPPRTVSEIEV